MNEIKYLLTENQMPTAWYNIQADLPVPLPPILNPGSGQPISPADLAPLVSNESNQAGSASGAVDRNS
jgi:tryptophan synthase beta chain